MEKPDQPIADEQSLQGRTTTFSDAQIVFVVNQYQAYAKERRRVKINAFMKRLRTDWKQQTWLTPPPSRKTVEDMLLANGCRTRKSKPVRKGQYHPAVTRYFPHVQTVLDGKEVIISVGSHDYLFVIEYSKDMASDAIGGCAVAETETSELVKQAFARHCDSYPKPLAALLDNGSGNQKAAIDLGDEGVLIIKAYPYRPQTKGQIEGEFGLFEKKVSHIRIAGEDEKQQAMSIVKTIAEVYLRMRNQTPRCSVCPFTPEKLMKAGLDSQQLENAYEQLKKQQDARRQQNEQRLKISQELKDLAESIVKEQRLTGDRLRFKKSLNWIEISTLREAESQFALLSSRDNFDPNKRNMAYFYAIARNLQRQKDQELKKQIACRRYGLDKKSREKRQEIRQAIVQHRQSKEQPYLPIIQAVTGHITLPQQYRATVTLFKALINEGIESLLKLKKATQQKCFDKTFEEIMALSEFPLETRYEMVDLVKNQMGLLTKNAAEVVTPN